MADQTKTKLYLEASSVIVWGTEINKWRDNINFDDIVLIIMHMPTMVDFVLLIVSITFMNSIYADMM